MQPTSQLTRALNGIATEVVLQQYADRILVLVTQLGKAGNLIQASIPSTTTLIPTPADSSLEDVPLVTPPSSIELTPLFGGAPNEHLATLHSLYASHIATLIWSSLQPGGIGDRRNVILAIALKRGAGSDNTSGMDDSERSTFKGVLKMVKELL